MKIKEKVILNSKEKENLKDLKKNFPKYFKRLSKKKYRELTIN
jgi:hypothetical protein